MTDFHLIATVLSMVLGLGVTRLLLGLVTVFRIRRQSRADWVPLVWAVVVFVVQLQFWWAINQLPSVKPSFNFVDFTFMVALTFSLFLAAALLLPSRVEDEGGGLREYFESDGRWSLLALSVFLTLGFIANTLLFEESPLALWGAVDVVMIVLPVVTFVSRSRRVYATLTIVYLCLAILDVWIANAV